MKRTATTEEMNAFLHDNRLKGKELADILEIKPAFMSAILTGRKNLPIDRFELLLRKEGYSFQAFGLGESAPPQQESNASDPFIVQMKSIPLVPMVAMCGIMTDDDCGVREEDCDRIVCPRDIPAEMAISVSGESMLPNYPVGARVFIRRAEKDYIELGHEYVINTVHGTALKILKRGETDATFRAESFNPNFEPYEIRKEDIRSIWQILAITIIK